MAPSRGPSWGGGGGLDIRRERGGGGGGLRPKSLCTKMARSDFACQIKNGPKETMFVSRSSAALVMLSSLGREEENWSSWPALSSPLPAMRGRTQAHLPPFALSVIGRLRRATALHELGRWLWRGVCWGGVVRDVLEERRWRGGRVGSPPPPMVPPGPAPKALENIFKLKSSCAKSAEENFASNSGRGGEGGRGGPGGGGAPPMVVSCCNTSLGVDGWVCMLWAAWDGGMGVRGGEVLPRRAKVLPRRVGGGLGMGRHGGGEAEAAGAKKAAAGVTKQPQQVRCGNPYHVPVLHRAFLWGCTTGFLGPDLQVTTLDVGRGWGMLPDYHTSTYTACEFCGKYTRSILSCTSPKMAS